MSFISTCILLADLFWKTDERLVKVRFSMVRNSSSSELREEDDKLPSSESESVSESEGESVESESESSFNDASEAVHLESAVFISSALKDMATVKEIFGNGELVKMSNAGGK